MWLTTCKTPKNGGIKSITIIPIEINKFMYDKKDLKKDLSLKRVYGKFNRKPIVDFETALKQLSLSMDLEKIMFD